MISLKCLVLMGMLGSLAVACGSDDASGTSGAVNPSDCAAVGAQQKKLIAAVGCDDNSAEIEAGCKQLYAAKICLPQWEALVKCITPKPSSDFECDSVDELELKTGVCTAERTAFDSCIDPS